MNNWPTIKLGEVVTHRKEFIEIDDLQTYKRCRVQLHVKGIVLRDEIEGALIKTKYQQVCRTNEFLVAEIDAKVGGYGIVPSELNSAIVSSHYFLFAIDELKLEPQFLGYYIKTPFFRDQVSAQGTTNYAAIRPQHVLNYTIPLPPLSEQRRIVAKIEQLEAKVDEARRLRQQSEAIVSFLLIQCIKKLLQPTANWRKSTISDCSLLSTGTTPPSHREEYFGGKIQWYTPGDLGFEKNLNRSSRTITELAVRDNKARLFEPGTILLVAIGGSLGKVGLTTEICSSNQQITGIKFIPEVDAEFGFWWLRSRYHELRNAAPEATLPILNQRRLGAISFSYPSLDKQRRIIAYLDGLQAQVDRLKALQAQTAVELEALLPSILDKAFKGEL